MIKTTKKIKRVAFFGDAMVEEKSHIFQDVLVVSKLAAQAGYIIVNGGGPGVMLAASRGAKSVNGKVEIVILNPDKQPKNYEGTNQENLEMADRVYTTEDYPERLNTLIKLADAFVIFDGGTGTLSEVGMTWELAKFNNGHHKPLVFFGEQWGKIVTDIEKGMKFETIEKGVVSIAKTPQEVIEILTMVERA